MIAVVIKNAKPLCACFKLVCVHLAFLTYQFLKQVDVGSNNLGAEGGKALAESLKSNTTITQVC